LEKERLERERQKQLERERQEKEKQKQLERERIERERQEREKQKQLEKERLEKERLEREKQKQLEKERQEREKQKQLEKERLERERIEKEKRLEKERKEKSRLEKLIELDTTQTDSEGLKRLKQNNSIDNLKYKKKIRYKTEKKPEQEELDLTSPGYDAAKKKKFSRFLQTPDEAYKEEKISKKKLFMSQTEEQKEKELIGKPRKEGYTIEIPLQKFTKGKIEDESEKSSKYGEKDELYKGKQKKKMNIRIEDDNSSGQVTSEHFTSEDYKYESFRKKKNKKFNLNLIDQDEENKVFGKKKKYILRHQESLKSNLSESFLRGMPTKIKIYKCVIWRNLDPSVNTDTIKNILHRSGSQSLKKGFVVKLPTKAIKSSLKEAIISNEE